MKKIILLFTVGTLASCSSIKVKRLEGTETIKNEYYYVLPKTALVFTIPVKTTTYSKGDKFISTLSDPEINYCVEKFGLDKTKYQDLVAKKTISPEIKLGDVTFTTIAKPDFNKIFKVIPNKRFLNSQTFSFTYTSDGIASESELSSENKTTDLVFKAIDGVVSIISALKSSDAVSVTQPSFNGALKKLDELTDLYITLKTSGSIIGDVTIYKEKLQNMEKLINKEFSLLFYEEKTVTETLQLVFCPDTEPNSEIRLFKLNGNSIVINTAYQNQCEVFGPATLSSFGTLSDNVCFRVNLSNKNSGLGASFTGYTKGVSGYAYNIPAKYKLTITKQNNNLLLCESIKLPQFGIIGSLSRKQSKASIQWNTETGELKKVTGESKALAGESISGVATSIKGGIDAAKGDDEITTLEKEVKLLELKKKYQDLKATAIE